MNMPPPTTPTPANVMQKHIDALRSIASQLAEENDRLRNLRDRQFGEQATVNGNNTSPSSSPTFSGQHGDMEMTVTGIGEQLEILHSLISTLSQ